jgi:predicted transcriptional regulator
MAKTVPVLARVSPTVKKRLEDLARHTKRSEATVAAEAIAEYLRVRSMRADVIERRLAKANSSAGRFVPHDEAMDWFMSLGTDRPLPKPKGRRLSEL